MANASVEGSAVGKKLVELRVVDLRAELENRGLEKNGVKAVLIERLEKALQEEGKNPDEFLFEESESTPKKASGRQSSRLQEKDQTKDDDEEDYEDEDAEGENNETSEIAKGAEKEKDTLEEKPVNQQNLSKNSADDHERIGKKVQDNVTKDATLKSERERKSDESDSSTNSSPVKSAKDDRTENHSAAKNVATVVQSQAALGESKVPIKKDGNSGDSAAPPQSSSSSADSSKIEEKMDTSSNPQARKSEDVEGNGAKIVSQSTSEIQLDMSEIASPSPTSVSSVAPLTSKDAVDMDTSINQQNEESESLVVHVDDTQNDLDADLLASRSEGKTTKIEAGQTGGKIDVKKPESTPEAGDKGKTEMKTEKKGDEKKDDKDVKLKSSSTKVKIIKNVKGVNQNSRNLWVSGLSSSTRATDLKGLFTKYGKVVGAKVVTNARSPGARCYGFVTMSSADEASKCIQHLHRTELHGRMISVERAKNEPGTQNIKKMEVKPNADKKIVDSKKDEKKEGEKKEAEKKDGEKKDDKKDSRRDKKPDEKKDTRKIDEKRRGSHKVTDKSRVVVMDKEKGEPVISVKRTGDKDADSKDKEKDKLVHASGDGKEKHVSRVQTQSVSAASTAGTVSTPAPKGKARENKKDILSFDQIKEERERERLRQRERRLREEERRRIRELERARQRQRDIQRRQNEEAFRLEREREKIRLERERLERERLETERLRLERERLEREREREEQRRLELLRLEEQQRRAIKRPYDGRDESYWNEPKRPSVGGVRYDYSHSHDNRYTDFDHRDQGRYSDRNMNSNELYERRVERYDRRDGRSLESGRFDDRKGRDMGRREVGPVHNVRDRDEKRPDDRNRPEERFDRRDVGPGRDHSRDRSHEPDRRDMGADRGRDSDRRNMSAHDRLGRVRNLTAVALVEQRQQWGTGVERNKMENWSHSHTNLETGNVNRPDRWIGSSASSQHERGGSGGNYSITSGNMVQNMGSNMYMNQQTQPPNMMVGGGNVGNRQQEPRFDAYKNMGGNMRRY